MREKEAAEQRVMLGLDGAALAHAFDALRAAAARAVQCKPVSARFEPGTQRSALRSVGIRTCDVGNQQAAHRQPFRQIGEVIRDRRLNVLLGEKSQQSQPRVIMIVPALEPGGKPPVMRCARDGSVWVIAVLLHR